MWAVSALADLNLIVTPGCALHKYGDLAAHAIHVFPKDNPSNQVAIRGMGWAQQGSNVVGHPGLPSRRISAHERPEQPKPSINIQKMD